MWQFVERMMLWELCRQRALTDRPVEVFKLQNLAEVILLQTASYPRYAENSRMKYHATPCRAGVIIIVCQAHATQNAATPGLGIHARIWSVLPCVSGTCSQKETAPAFPAWPSQLNKALLCD
jgi:hypothetical protein